MHAHKQSLTAFLLGGDYCEVMCVFLGRWWTKQRRIFRNTHTYTPNTHPRALKLRRDYVWLRAIYVEELCFSVLAFFTLWRERNLGRGLAALKIKIQSEPIFSAAESFLGSCLERKNQVSISASFLPLPLHARFSLESGKRKSSSSFLFYCFFSLSNGLLTIFLENGKCVTFICFREKPRKNYLAYAKVNAQAWKQRRWASLEMQTFSFSKIEPTEQNAWKI